MIAALYVKTNGSYFGLPHVDPWDEVRDARKYNGPYPVVAHPPCQRWGKMYFGSPQYVARTGIRKKKGDDNGCFKAALDSVREHGGILEHPWGSHAWPHFGLNKHLRVREVGLPPICWGDGTCCVEQGRRYGHYARKPTLLYAFGVELPELVWGHSEARLDHEYVKRVGIKKAKRAGELSLRGGGVDSGARISTPKEFRDLLLSIAATAKGKQDA